MIELLLPRTDAGVAVQTVLFVVLFGATVWRLWHRPETRLLLVGSGLVLVGLLGLRAAH